MECVSWPSSAQIALALAIVKLKPVGIDIKGATSCLRILWQGLQLISSSEYILQRRKSIKSSKAAEIFHWPEKFFDSVSFWRQAYERSEAEQSKLLDRIFELEERNEALTAKLHPREETTTKSAVKLPLKRKDTNNQSTEKQTKKQRHSMKGSLAAEVEISRLDDSECKWTSSSFIIYTDT